MASDIKATSIEEFYKQIAPALNKDLDILLPQGISKEIGHFNVFKTNEVYTSFRLKNGMPYNRRAYYKISLINGKNRAEYADKVIEIEKNALLFATPKVPYNYYPLEENQGGYFCVFTEEFLIKNKTGVVIDELPLFKPGGYPVFNITTKEVKELSAIFEKMFGEVASDYAYKYDLIRNYVLELIHFGQKLQPAGPLQPEHNASERIASLFIKLLERQFPLESPQQKLGLSTPKDYAERLSVHVNHLNKVLKENTNRTTSELLTARIALEAKLLLRQTDWSISEIAYSLGFEEVSHFSNFFKKQASLSPLEFRTNQVAI